MGYWWQDAASAVVNPMKYVGGLLPGTVGNVVSGVADPGSMIGGKAGDTLSAVTNPAGMIPGQMNAAANDEFWQRQMNELGYRSSDPLGHLSGSDKVDTALKDQMAYADKGVAQLGQSYADARGLLAPYQQGGATNYQNFQNMIQNGSFNPAYQQYAGQTQAGNQFIPQRQAYQGPMSSSISQPQFQGGGQNPQFQGPQGPMTTGNVNPQYQAYQGPMSSGILAPQYQQYGGASDFQAQARPDRQAGTTANVNMYNDPGYQFRLDQGLNAIQGSAAARGLLSSSGTLKGINDYAQQAASQEFGNAYGRQQADQNNLQQNFESDRAFNQNNFGQNFARGYGMNQDANAFNMNAANFNQTNFNNDRAFGYQASQAPNQFNQQNADRTQAGLMGDRAANLQVAGMQNEFNQQNAGRSLTAADMQNQFNQQNASRVMQGNQFDMNFNYGANQDLNNWNAQNADRGYAQFTGDRNFGYGMNQDQNAWNAAQAQNRYNQWNNMVGIGYNAANAGANLATGYGQNLSELYAGQGNAQAAAGIAKANAQSGLVGQGAGLLGMVMGG